MHSTSVLFLAQGLLLSFSRHPLPQCLWYHSPHVSLRLFVGSLPSFRVFSLGCVLTLCPPYQGPVTTRQSVSAFAHVLVKPKSQTACVSTWVDHRTAEVQHCHVEFVSPGSAPAFIPAIAAF